MANFLLIFRSSEFLMKIKFPSYAIQEFKFHLKFLVTSLKESFESLCKVIRKQLWLTWISDFLFDRFANLRFTKWNRLDKSKTRFTKWNRLDKRETLYTINFTKICLRSFYIQNGQNRTPSYVKWAPKWKLSDLIDYSVIFNQICLKLPLYIKWAKIKPIPKISTL